jgi:hypothetical protein
VVPIAQAAEGKTLALEQQQQELAVADTQLLKRLDAEGKSIEIQAPAAAAATCAVQKGQQPCGPATSIAAVAALWVTEEARELQRKAALVLGEAAVRAQPACRPAPSAPTATPGAGAGTAVGRFRDEHSEHGWAEAIENGNVEKGYGNATLQQQRAVVQEQAANLVKRQESLKVNKGRVSPRSLQRAYDEGIER